MDKKNRFKRILNNSGESLMYVFVIMIFFIIISVSVTAAVTSNYGYEIKQKEHSQIMLLDNSVHKNIMYSLQADPTSDGMLSKQIVKALYESNDPVLHDSYLPGGLGTIPVSVSFSEPAVSLSDGSVKLKSVKLSFIEQNVIIHQQIPAVYSSQNVTKTFIKSDGDVIQTEGYIEPNVDHAEIAYIDSISTEGETIQIAKTIRNFTAQRIPKKANIIATMAVTVEIQAGERTITSRAIYDYVGGELSDDLIGEHSEDDSGESYNMEFTPTGYGNWRLVRHEYIDTKT